MNNTEATWMASPSERSSTRVATTFNRVESPARMTELYALLADDQQILKRQRDTVKHPESRGSDLCLDDRSLQALIGAGAAFTGLVVHDADAPVGLQRVGQVPQEADAARFFPHFLIHVDDQHGIQRSLGQIRVGVRSEAGDDVGRAHV